MSRDHLGLFDTPPDRRQVRFSQAIVGVLFFAFLLILPVGNTRMRELDAFVPVANAVMCLGDLITAALLLSQAAVFRSRALTVLGAIYIYTALMLIPHALTFPGAFSRDGLLGAGLNTTSWLAYLRRLAFPIAVILYVQLKRADSATQPGPTRPPPRILAAACFAVALAAAATLAATLGRLPMPPIYINRSDLIYANAIAYESVIFTVFAIATVMLFRQRSSVLDMWLLVAQAGWLVQSLLIMTLHGRFTAGFYWLYVVMMFSHLVVMLALIAESNRHYAQLALATSARNREREARRMSIDAVAVAIAHEVGQPLTAVSLHARASLNRLMRPRPDVEKAIGSLQATIDAGRRATDVVTTVRAMFAERPDLATELSLNDLVRETVATLERDLAAEDISLQLALADPLPPVLADRVQMQRVVLNLFTNAIESLGATRGRSRRIAVRSALLDSHDVLVEISDNGLGVPADEIEHIFDPFHESKAKGVGLGLSLCRTIVGAHGGRLWASRGETHGATFHLQLPRSDLPAELHDQGWSITDQSAAAGPSGIPD